MSTRRVVHNFYIKVYDVFAGESRILNAFIRAEYLFAKHQHKYYCQHALALFEGVLCLKTMENFTLSMDPRTMLSYNNLISDDTLLSVRLPTIGGKTTGSATSLVKQCNRLLGLRVRVCLDHREAQTSTQWKISGTLLRKNWPTTTSSKNRSMLIVARIWNHIRDEDWLKLTGSMPQQIKECNRVKHALLIINKTTLFYNKTDII